MTERTKPMRSNARRNRGFTLLEVVLAMSLVSIIAAVGFAVLRTGIRSWDAGEAHRERLERRVSGMGFFRNILANALPAYDDFTEKKRIFTFVGAPDAVRFVAFPPEHVGQGMRYRFDLSLADGVLGVALEPFGKRLLRVLAEPERIPLLDGVRQARFAYFGRPPDQRTPEWREDWRFDTLPELVRITVETADGAAESIVALRQGGRR